MKNELNRIVLMIYLTANKLVGSVLLAMCVLLPLVSPFCFLALALALFTSLFSVLAIRLLLYLVRHFHVPVLPAWILLVVVFAAAALVPLPLIGMLDTLFGEPADSNDILDFFAIATNCTPFFSLPALFITLIIHTAPIHQFLRRAAVRSTPAISSQSSKIENHSA